MNQTLLSGSVWSRHVVVPRSGASDIGRSLRSQRLCDVDARGARRRQRRRDDRGGQQNNRRGGHWRGTRHLHVLEIPARQTYQRVSGHRASDDACGRHHGTFGDDTRQEMTRLRSKCQPDAELACAGADGEGENACDADQGNGKSDGRKDTEHNCVETIRSENFGANVFEGSGAFNGLFDRHLANDPRDRRDERIRICAGVDKESTAKHWALFKRVVDREDGPRNDVFVVNIGGDANNAVRRGVNPGDEFHDGIRPEDVAVDSILIGEHSLRESLTYDNDRFLALAVESVEITAGDDGSTVLGKESGRDSPQLRARIFFPGPAKVAVRRELETRTKTAGIAPRNNNAESRLVHTR